MNDPAFLLACLFFLAACLYSTVGHGGASAYLAVMALAGFSPAFMRPCALWMNVAVAAIATVLFFQAGHFRPRLFWPFIALSIPAAWLGGTIRLDPKIFTLLVGACLLIASVRLFVPERERESRRVSLPVAVGIGGVLGFVSGLVGVGGGIFLTPLLLLAGWAKPKEAAAVSAPFILLNSLGGLGGLYSGQWQSLPPGFFLWLPCVVLGGLLGATMGSRHWRPAWLRPALGLVLLIASAKFGLQVFS
ncbi:MAG: sulfite exporter TauE/SafE family protein [Chthoniobacterales bacterium]|jgi:uncharacterized membrane protein YfcA|nr:sulfite exporter TauE/SafE family protein [Chthoniobacterales bacterium]